MLPYTKSTAIGTGTASDVADTASDAQIWTQIPWSDWLGNYLLSLEKSDRTAQRVQEIDLYGLPAVFYKSYARRMGSVSPELLQKTAQTHLDATDTLIVVVGEAKEVRPALDAIGPVTVYGTDLKPMPAAK